MRKLGSFQEQALAYLVASVIAEFMAFNRNRTMTNKRVKSIRAKRVKEKKRD